jgi:iron complex outermembrane receptor protein
MIKRLYSYALGSLLAGLSFFFSSITTAYESSEPPGESEFFVDIPIITSATRLPQKIDKSPVAISYISRKMIADSGATEVAQILGLAPGFLSYSVVGNQFGVTHRGLSYRFPGDLEITVDGRSVYSPIFSTVDWTTLGITPEDIHYIEVVRGTNAAAYGSNAFLGAIHIVTNLPAREKGLSLNIAAGDSETRNGQLDWSGQAGIFDFSMGVVYRHNEGFPEFASQPLIDRNIDGNEATNFRFEAIASPTIQDTLRFHAGFGHSRTQIPKKGLEGGGKGFIVREVDSQYQLLRWKRTLSDNNELQVQFYHNRSEFDQLVNLGLISDALGVRPDVIPLIFPGQSDQVIVAGIDDALSERYDLEINRSFAPNSKARGIFGTAIRFDRIRSDYLLNRDDALDRWSYRMFGTFEYAITDRLLGSIGIMAEDSSMLGTLWSPRLALNYSLNAFNTLRASAAHGKRMTSLLETSQDESLRFSDGTVIEGNVITDPNIAESTVTEFDIAHMGSYFNGRLTSDLRLIRTEARDIIDDARTGLAGGEGAVIRNNFIDWNTNGWDGQIKYQLGAYSNISLAYAYTDFDGEHSGRRVVQSEFPRHIASLLASTELFGLDLSTTLYYRSEIRWQDGDRLKSNLRTDVRIAKRFDTSIGTLGFELIGKSLFNSYPEYQREQRFEPAFFVKLSYRPN